MSCDLTTLYIERKEEYIHDHLQALAEIHDEIKDFGLQKQFNTETLLLLSTIKFFSHKDELE